MLVRTAVYMLAAALAAVPIATGAERSPPSATTAGEPGLFAYDRLNGGIFTVRADGTGNRKILRFSNDPVWSPDGTRLLYSRGEGFHGLWWARPDGTDAHRIIRKDLFGTRGGPCNTRYGAAEGAWSPSGRRVVFEGLSSDRYHEICTAALDGSRVRRLRRGYEPEWLPDGRRIAFIPVTPGPGTRIATMRRDGSDVRMLLADAKGFRWDLDVSPHGHKLAFTESYSYTNTPPQVLRIMDLRTGRTTTIPQSETGPIGGFAWSPGATRIVYFDTSREPRADRRAYSIRPDGTDRKLLFTLPYDERRRQVGDSLSWQPRR